MQASHDLARVSVSFDDDTLLPNGGLAVATLLAQKLGVADLIDEHVTIGGEAGANGGAKAATVIGSALAGGDCIDDTRVLQAGATRRLFDGVRAASTVGIWLRAFIWASVGQLDRVTRELLRRAWQAGLGPDLAADLTIDVDSTVCETYGLAKQGATGFAYTGVRGYPLIASLAETGELLHTRLVDGRFVAKFAWSGQAARRVAHEIGVLTALSSGTDVPFLPEIVASSLDPVMLVTRRVAGATLFEVVNTIDRDRAARQLAAFLAALHHPATSGHVQAAVGATAPTQNRRPHPSCCRPDSAGGCAPISSEP
jgi:hypothetical protein